MKIPSIITDKKKRDDLREKVEVVFAVVTIVGFTTKKLQERKKSNA